MRRTLPLLAMSPFLAGCGAAVARVKAIPTYAEPVASAPPTGSVRIVPQPPVLTPTKATYEWQVVCDRVYSSTSSTNATTVLSASIPSNRFQGRLPTVLTYYVEIATTPHGDGSMAVKVTQGQRDVKTRPLLQPSAPALGGGGGLTSSELDGYRQVPASTFVHPLVAASTLVAVPGGTDLARIDLPAPAYCIVEAVKPDPKAPLGMKSAYRKAFPVDAKGRIPNSAFDDPKLVALEKQGYQAMAQGTGAPASRETARIEFKP